MSIKDNQIARARQKAKLLLAREDFNSDVATLRGQQLSKVEFDQAIYKLTKKYKLGPSWTLGLKLYAESLDPNMLLRRNAIDILDKVNRETGLTELWIRVDSHTTLEDIKEDWSFVKGHQGRLEYADRKKNRLAKKLEHNKRAYDLKQSGEKNKRIAEILDEEFNIPVTPDDIPTMIRNYKRLQGIN